MLGRVGRGFVGGVLVAAAVVFGVTTAQAVTGSSASCSVVGSYAVSGGYSTQLSCSNGSFQGVGSTLSDSVTEAKALAEFHQRTGTLCSTYGSFAINGGYRVELNCTNGAIHAAGSTLSSSATEARALAEFHQRTGTRCFVYGSFAVSGGYQVELHCANGAIHAVGSTLSDASTEARALAEHYQRTGNRCFVNSSFPADGGYRVQLYCTTSSIMGTGSTLTAAARDAHTRI
ncbi:hypothetical protein [Actinokineospora globicatena]|uniref:Uncharacterized protein n=1 Tax=Actinokineospora globicatena TaxID=103729 RepID=A0A9W6V4Z3_9PSEU|nr:hypothetical protein [Actinokineospora globicatena]GLW89765.1 hypothetical protein Aglo03_05810 [Actinokineospora globicatena]